MDEHQKGIQLGLRAAATFLECEADDLAARRAGRAYTLNAAQIAELLRNMANDVRRLEVTRGR